MPAPPKLPPACDHTWELAHKTEIISAYTNPPNQPIDTIFVLQCTKCGEMTNHRLKAE